MLDSEHFKNIERFTVILFDKLSLFACINKARMELFARITGLWTSYLRQRYMNFHFDHTLLQYIYPYVTHIFTLSFKDALLQHVKRCIYQAGVWTTSEISQQVLPSPGQFSWIKKVDTWVPMWITILEVSKACSELIKCSCKGICSRCKCIKANLKCVNA